ncbi:MAG: hypothetical protein RLZZ455_773 [Candidatus Parcubacteria bacterium]
MINTETKQDQITFSSTQLRDAGLLVEGHFPGITTISVSTSIPKARYDLPVESRLGREQDGSPITTFYPVDMELGKEIILGKTGQPTS